MDKEKIVIVTGGANGLGNALVSKLHQKGFYVVNIDKDECKLREMAVEYPSRYIGYVGNIMDGTFVQSCISSIDQYGKIFAVINNAGTPVFKLPHEYDSKEIGTCFEGPFGMFLVTACVLRKHEPTHELRIVNIMSLAALRGNANESVYCAAKWAERGYTESLRRAYSGTKVRIYVIYPGGINTDFYRDSRDYVPIEKQQTFMSPAELADVIISNVFNNKQLIVEDIMINRMK